MLSKLFDGSFMPHGQCLLWRWDLLFLHVVGDVLTVLAYTLIPISLVYLVHKRNDLKFNRIFLLFAGFIAFCGISHFLGLINIWNGYYYLAGLTKFVTGIVSIVTAFVLWRLIPKILELPSAALLAERNADLLETREELERTNETLERKIEERTNQLYIEANTDYLTGISNRRAILGHLQREVDRTKRYHRPCSIMMLDVDHFKTVNDNYGHQVGDDVLILIAKTLTETCREADHIGRYGGEEFLIVLPETSHPDALELAERLRQNVAALKPDIDLQLTASIGVASLDAESETDLDRFIKQADDAVYQAKNLGRNRVVSDQEI